MNLTATQFQTFSKKRGLVFEKKSKGDYLPKGIVTNLAKEWISHAEIKMRLAAMRSTIEWDRKLGKPLDGDVVWHRDRAFAVLGLE